MKTIRVLLLALLGLTATFPSAHATTNDLGGLWSAKRWFGPFERGPLVIRRTGSGYTADMLGRQIPMRIENGELVFDLPGKRGTFRGRLDKGLLSGHWFQPQGQYATPVHFTAESANQWSGVVEPVEDTFTLHLFVRPSQGDTSESFLNNPEQNYGDYLLGVKRLVSEGDSVRLIGKYPWEKKESVVARGTYDRASQTITIGFPSRGGSYDFHRDDEFSDFYPRGKNPGRYAYQPPTTVSDGWPTGTLEEVGIDRRGIERLVQMLMEARVDSASTARVHGLLIARHGKLVLEEYFHGENRDRLHETRSAAKSAVSVLVGAAMRSGKGLALTTPVYQLMNGGSFPPNLESRKKAMTLENLLTMSSGWFCDDTNSDAPGNEDKMWDQTEQPDFYRYTLGVPMATTPGEKAVYCSCNANLALGMAGRALGESPLYFFDREIAGPMQIRRYGWNFDPAQNLYGGGGIKFFPRDFMKFGQLMLDGGTWRQHRILTPEFVKRASSPLYHLRGRLYGYFWWGIEYPYKDRTVYAYYAGGNGGQSVIVIPELDLVIASYGGNYNANSTFYMQMTVTPRDLLPCIREKGDDPKAPVIPRQDYAPKLGPREEAGPVTKEVKP